ncbi:transporter substrate-binding domain-containing protein [Oscillatoria sp. FACHB-1407]|uniref:transporter substrate-binding domain-containing protein n=1 Tax=Oscillatoria sp. FACHB-1407 TaxID=2692847 RepID=UPI0016832FD8|nr:transporter substrate-binding domain-containing protein [Oscillatoria sp. FACHB-1407]MBD2461587.1 transporter substrate-binding domain-containing protein [Oscillatoria sp. FACHB-1407]
MKRLKYLFTALFSALLTVVIVAGCGSQQPTDTASPAAGTSPAASPAETLVMATSADYPPYEFIDTSGGEEKIVGFDVDIANYITSQLGYGLEINNIDFNGLIPALQSGRADFVMAGMTPTEERKQNADFSQIYYTAQNTIVAKTGSNLADTTSLSGKRVGVQLGSIQEEAAGEIEGANVVPLNRINEIIQELKAGRIDAAIVENTVAQGYIEANPDLEFNTIPPSGPAGSAIAFPKGSELVAKFDPVLTQMIDSGEIDKLVTKWFGDQQAAPAS